MNRKSKKTVNFLQKIEKAFFMCYDFMQYRDPHERGDINNEKEIRSYVFGSVPFAAWKFCVCRSG